MTDLDKLALELLAAEFERSGASAEAVDSLRHADLVSPAIAVSTRAIHAALLTAPPGCVLVPVELIDAFPEINPSNYDHDQACRLNAWGCQVVTTAAPEVK